MAGPRVPRVVDADDPSSPKPTKKSRPRVWVIGSGDESCDHPPADLERVGDDGLNGYYKCGRCGAGLVVQGEVQWFL